jgi:hypothetical protein
MNWRLLIVVPLAKAELSYRLKLEHWKGRICHRRQSPMSALGQKRTSAPLFDHFIG